MRLTEIIHILKTIELKQIVVKDDEDFVLSLLNFALIEVYGKFSILQEEQVINVTDGKTRYHLQPNSQKVLQVYTRNLSTHPLLGKDGFKEVPLNDINCDDSVFTPEPYILHIPKPDFGSVYSVMQVVTPPMITKENIETIDFFVPPQLLQPIADYVAYRAYKSMNGDAVSEISSHYKSYINSCNEVLRKGLLNQSIITNTKLEDRGY